MSMAFIKRKCAHCGKDLSQEKRIVIMADVQWVNNKSDYAQAQDSHRVKFSPGIDTRSAYCDVHCLKKDLDKYLDNAVFTRDRQEINTNVRLN